ncbi:MAG: hypothetical protein ACUVSK_08505, partial [Desulfotomaculales bacterium]
ITLFGRCDQEQSNFFQDGKNKNKKEVVFMLEINNQKFEMARLTDTQLARLKEAEKNLNPGGNEEIYLLAVKRPG